MRCPLIGTTAHLAMAQEFATFAKIHLKPTKNAVYAKAQKNAQHVTETADISQPN